MRCNTHIQIPRSHFAYQSIYLWIIQPSAEGAGDSIVFLCHISELVNQWVRAKCSFAMYPWIQMSIFRFTCKDQMFLYIITWLSPMGRMIRGIYEDVFHCFCVGLFSIYYYIFYARGVQLEIWFCLKGAVRVFFLPFGEWSFLVERTSYDGASRLSFLRDGNYKIWYGGIWFEISGRLSDQLRRATGQEPKPMWN